MDPMRNTEFEKEQSKHNGPRPPLRDLFIAEEQPDEASAVAVAYLNAHPEVRQFIERQKALERMAGAMDSPPDFLSPDFEADEDGDSSAAS
jgi:hypothetical protein